MADDNENKSADDGSIVIWGSAQSGKTSLITALLLQVNEKKDNSWAIRSKGADTRGWMDEIFAEFCGKRGNESIPFEFPRRTRVEELHKVRTFEVTVPRGTTGMPGKVLSMLGM